tara:strand:+ start:2971 stop:3123 length:153 start_codon:yes stop_codon:yes gene_type:complete
LTSDLILLSISFLLALLGIKVLFSGFDDDDDEGGGMGSPVFEPALAIPVN